MADTVCEYALPTVPPGRLAGLTTIGAAAMVTVYARVPDAPLPSVARTVKLLVPAAVGVPASAPLDALSVSPAGSDPALIAKVYAPLPPVAVIVWL